MHTVIWYILTTCTALRCDSVYISYMTHTRIHTNTLLSFYLYMLRDTHIQAYTNIHAHIHKCIQTDIHTTYVRTYKHTYTHTYIHKYIHMHSIMAISSPLEDDPHLVKFKMVERHGELSIQMVRFVCVHVCIYVRMYVYV